MDPVFAIVHPYGYTGDPGPISVTVCIEPGSEALLPSLGTAIQVWNNLIATVGNCSGPCLTYGETPATGDKVALDTLLHELGHCALGLGHVNLEGYNFTATRDSTSITNGTDLTPGSRDDIVVPLPGSKIIHWFRNQDNDPFVVDALAISNATFSRVFDNLPSGSLWPASGNRLVGVILGQPQFTQSVMFGLGSRQTVLSGLAADDVNTVKYAANGLDEAIGGDDDYSVQISYVTDCVDADVIVRFGQRPNSEFGVCAISRALIPIVGQVDRHYRLIRDATHQPVLTLNRSVGWDVSSLPFSDDFESGVLDFWITRFPSP